MLVINFTVVLCSMTVVYFMVFRRIRRMINLHGKTFSNQSYHYNVLNFSERDENRPLCGATQAMVLQGQKDARRRVCLFFTIYIITGFMGIVIILCEF